jgi:hypothetical protein
MGIIVALALTLIALSPLYHLSLAPRHPAKSAAGLFS